MSRTKFVDSMTLAQAARILGAHEKMLLPHVECGLLSPAGITGMELYEFGKQWRTNKIDNEVSDDELGAYKYAREQERLRPARELKANVLKMYDALMARHAQKSRMTLIKSEVS